MIRSCRIRHWIAVGGTVLVAAGWLGSREVAAAEGKKSPVRVLMFIGGIAHDYEALPKQLAENLDKQGDLKVEVTSDLDELNAGRLAEFDVILLNTCIEKGLGEARRKDLVDALRNGKGLIGLHCALWTFQDWPEFRKILGGLVLKHDKFAAAPNVVVDRGHPIATGLPEKFDILSEPYFVNKRGRDIHVIVQTARSYADREGVEPQVWTTRYAGARVCAITYGHDEKSQGDPKFLELLGNAVRWTGGRLGPATMLSELERKQGFVPVFDGKTLDGWRYDPKLWRVKDGIIVGNSYPDGLKTNSCAVTERSYSDFILRFSAKYVSGNSGVQFRSKAHPNFEVSGYQSDIVLPSGWGNLHEQDGRRRLVDGWTGKADRAVSGKDWNEMEIEARGPHILLRTNGVVTADWTEKDPAGARDGIIGLQLHRDDPMEVQFTNIRVKMLKSVEK